MRSFTVGSHSRCERRTPATTRKGTMRMPEMAPRLRDCRPRRAGRGSPARRPRCPCLSRMRRTGPAPKRSRCATFGRVCASGPRGPGRVSDPGRRARAARRRWAPVRAAMPSRGRPGWSRAQRPAMPRATRDTRARPHDTQRHPCMSIAVLRGRMMVVVPPAVVTHVSVGLEDILELLPRTMRHRTKKLEITRLHAPAHQMLGQSAP